MSNSVVNLDDQFTILELRTLLKDLLCIDSVFPCFMPGEHGSTAHCILPIKPGEENEYESSWCDHILCKVLRKVPRQNEDGPNATDNVNVSSVKVSYL